MSCSRVSLNEIKVLSYAYHIQLYNGVRLYTADLSFLFYIEQTMKELDIQNKHSCAFRYKDKDFKDHNCSLQDTWLELDDLYNLYAEYSIVELLKLTQHYMYNSSEHPEWTFSQGKKICDSIMSKLIANLPGWEVAPWGIA